MKTRLALLYTLLLATLCLSNMTNAAAALEITHPWIREAPPSAMVLAAYMLIRNPGKSTLTINDISSTDFESAELHRTVLDEDLARMLRITQLDVPANGTIKLEPGGLHLMLFNPQRMLTAGDTVTLTIQLGNGASMTVNVPVVRQDDDHSLQHH